MACTIGKLFSHLSKPFAVSKLSVAKGSLKPLLVSQESLLLGQPLVSCIPVSCCSNWSQRQKPKANKKKKFENEDEIPGTRYQDGPNKYQPKSPFKISTPRSYGYHENMFKGGLLPRDDKPFRSMTKYKPKDRWDEKHALFGQNDYIDILGDGDIHPADLQKGPSWLIGQKDRSELHRLLRRLRFDGEKLRETFPSKHHDMNKRVRYLYRRYNKRRSHRLGG